MRVVTLPLILVLLFGFIAVVSAEETVQIDKMPTMLSAPAGAKYALEYPASAKKDSVQGTVYISLTVKADGSAADVKVVQGVRADLDRAALQFIEHAKFTPAESQGKKVAITVTVPVKFKLEPKK